MNATPRRNRFSHLLLLALPLSGLALTAQEIRQELRQEAPQTTPQEPGRRALAPQPRAAEAAAAPRQAPRSSPRGRPLPPPCQVFDGGFVEPADDSPDFARMAPTDTGTEDRNRVARRAGNPYCLSFAGGDYEPEPGIDRRLLQHVAANPVGHTFGFVMLRGRMSRAKMQTLAGLGLELGDWHTYQSVAAKIPCRVVNDVARLPFVHWIGYARPDQKLDSSLQLALREAAEGQSFDIYVSFFASDLGAEAETIRVGERRELTDFAVQLPIEQVIPNGPFQQALEKIGFRFAYYNDTIHAMRGTATKPQILALRDFDFVQFVELNVRHRACHDQAIAMVSQDRVRSLFPGTGVALGYIDSGIDGTPTTHWHQDFSFKNLSGWDTTGQGVYADGNGHGTHVAGTLFGRGLADARYTGTAPNLGSRGGGTNNRIFVGRYLRDNGWSGGDVNDLYKAFDNTAPRRSIVSNSWGGSPPTTSGYDGSDTHSRTVDEVVHDNQQTYVFAAGNTDANPGVRCAAPGVAKNVLTVGGLTDMFSATVLPGTRYARSRFGTRDGRRKPEVAAPGDIHTSCANNTSTGYANMSGTSMATPTVAGVLASLEQHYQKTFRFNPATNKAVAIATAKARTAAQTVSLGFETQTGFGLIHADKMHYSGTCSYTTATDSLTNPTNTMDTFEVDVPSGIVASKVVLCWTESAASSGATKARKYSIKLYLDQPPYTSGATGESWMSSAVDNVVYATDFTPVMAGKRIRFKVYAESLAFLAKVNWSVCVLWYYQMPYINKLNPPQLTQAVNKTVVRPGENVLLTATMTSQKGTDEFDDARIFFSSPSSWQMVRIDRTGADKILQSYTGSTHPSFPYPRLATGPSGGMVVGQGQSRSIRFTLRAPTARGAYNLYTQAQYHGSSTPQQSSASVVCVDDQPPNAIGGLRAYGHTPGKWSNRTNLGHLWTQATDQGCAGVDRLYYHYSMGKPVAPGTASPSLSATAVSHSTTASDTSTGYYFNIRAHDKLGYVSKTTSVGPYLIDTTAPVVTSVRINNGATTTSSLQVKVVTTGTDTYSGLAHVQFSAHGISWSPLVAYSTGAQVVDLGTLAGGKKTAGVHRLHVRLRDQAGNYSAARLATIEYKQPPSLTAVAPTSLEAVNSDFFKLTGSNLLGVTRIRLGNSLYVTRQWSSAHDNDWAQGCFRRVSDSGIYLYPPQGLRPGDYSVVAYDGQSASNKLSVRIVANKGHVLRSSKVLTVGSEQTLLVTKAGLAKTVDRQILLASASNQPSVFKPFYNFGIGANFTYLIQFPQLGFDGNGVSTVVFPTVAVMKGRTAYFQVAYLDLTASTWPIPVSNVWSTSYK